MEPSATTTPTEVGHYRVVRPIGRGGMGSVVLARDVRLGRLVALKFLSQDLLGSPEVRAQFDVEARTTASLSHPNVVTLFDVGEHEGRPWVALEYIEGSTLAQRLQNDWPSIPESVRIGLAIARAIEAAHAAGIVHRDLKPANVLLGVDGRPRVVDFGVARFSSRRSDAPPADDGAGEGPLGILGTPSYMAPEQWDGRDSPATDVWALGLILHLLFARSQPFRDLDTVRIVAKMNEPDPVVVSPELAIVAPELAPLVVRCLAKSPAARPTASEVVAALSAIEAQKRAPKPTESPFRGLSAFSEKHAHLFFGRDAEIAGFVERLRHRGTLVVVGSSGAGKSSFLLAGVVPRLREGARHHVVVVRPQARPLRALAEALAGDRRARDTDSSAERDTVVEGARARSNDGADAQVDTVAELEARLRENPDALAVTLAELAVERDARVLLVIDQLEEVVTVTQDADERRAFLDALGSAGAEANEPVRVVMTVRDDFLGRIPWGGFAHRALSGVVLLAPPEPDALREIVARPLEAAGYAFDDETLLDEMVAEVFGESSCLPLVQFALSLMWARRDEARGLLLRAVYDRMGGVGGALAAHAEDVLSTLGPAEVDLCRGILLGLVTDQGTRRARPRTALVGGLADGADALVTKLVDARLLSAQRGAEGTVELAHESLTRVWPRLARWIEESHEDLALATDLVTAAERWDRRGRRADELWEGDALRDAVRLLSRGTSKVSGVAVALVRASEDREKRRARRKRVVVASMLAAAVLTAIASSMAAWALRERQRDATLAALKADDARARLLEERALASYASLEVHDARAQLRASLESRDSLALRSLSQKLARDPALLRVTDDEVTYDAHIVPSGRTLVTARQTGLVELVDTVTLERRLLRGHSDQVLAVATLADGRVVSASWNGELRLWDTSSGESRVLLKRAGFFGFAVRGSTVAVTSDGVVELVTPDAPPRAIEAPVSRTFGIVFEPGTERLLIGGEDGRVLALEIATGRVVRTSEKGSPVRRIAVASGRVLVSRRNGTLSVLDASTLVSTREIAAHEGDARGLVVAGDGRVWTGGLDRRIVAWDLGSGREVGSLPTRLSSITQLTVAPDGTTLVAAGHGGAEVWDLGRVGRAPRAPSHSDAVVDLRFASDGRSLFSASNRSILRWDVATGVPSARIVRTSKRGRDIAVDEKHGIAVATDERGGLSLWEIESGRFLATLGSHAVVPLGIAYAEGRDLAAVGTAEGTVLLFRPGARVLVREVAVLGAEVRGVVLSPDARVVYAGGSDGTVVAVDASSGAVTPVVRHTGRILGLSASHDGRALLLAGQDGVAARLDLATKAEVVLGKFPGRLQRLSASPDGRTVAVPSSDGNVYLLDIATGRRRSFVGNRSEVNVVAFDPSGKVLAVGGDDHTVRLFDVEKGEPLWRPRADLVDVDPGAAPTGKTDSAIRYTKPLEGLGTVVAFENGSVEIRYEKGGSVRPLRDTPSRPSTRVIAGPAGTLALGFEDGTFGLWDTSLGLALDRVALHGAVVGLRIDAGSLRGTSELGDTATLALDALSKDYCALVAEVRKDVPYVWRDGAIAPEARELPCRRP